MKLYLTVFIVSTLLVSVLARDRTGERRRAINKLIDRLDMSVSSVDKLNKNVCQSSSAESVVCELPGNKVEKTARCIFAPANGRNYNKIQQVKFEDKLENEPVIMVAASGASFFSGVDFELGSVCDNRRQFYLQTKADNFVAPFTIQADYFACPKALQFPAAP